MIDEAQRLLDVALAVARLCVVLADQPAQRSAHVLVGGGGRNAERFVQRGFHGRVATGVRRYAIGILVEKHTAGKTSKRELRHWRALDENTCSRPKMTLPGHFPPDCGANA